MEIIFESGKKGNSKQSNFHLLESAQVKCLLGCMVETEAGIKFWNHIWKLVIETSNRWKLAIEKN